MKNHALCGLKCQVLQKVLLLWFSCVSFIRSSTGICSCSGQTHESCVTAYKHNCDTPHNKRSILFICCYWINFIYVYFGFVYMHLHDVWPSTLCLGSRDIQHVRGRYASITHSQRMARTYRSMLCCIHIHIVNESSMCMYKWQRIFVFNFHDLHSLHYYILFIRKQF